MREQLSKKPTALFYSLGGTLGVAIIYIFKPPFLPPNITHNPARLLEFLLIWWTSSFVGALVTGQFKITGHKPDNDSESS